MVTKCNNADLANKGIDSKYFLLYQVWKELTCNKTLDTYQFRVMNTLSALTELKVVTEQYLKGYSKGDHNIKDCRIETNRLIKNDKVLQKYYPAIQNRLLSHLNGNLETEPQRRVLLYELEYVLKILTPQYFENLICVLERDIDCGNDSDIITETNQLVSCCINQGWSDNALFHVIDTLQRSESDPARWDWFKNKLCSNNCDEYHILLPLNIRPINLPRQTTKVALEKILEEIKRLGIRSLSIEDVQEQYSGLVKEKLADKDYLLFSVPARDVFSASQKAISKFSGIFNILSFYGLAEPWNLRDISWFVINTANQYVRNLKPKDLYSTYDYLESSSKVFRISKDLDKYADSSVRVRLQAVYSYANMGKVSYAQTEKYMNTWVALESLCRTETSDSIIGGIKEVVPPALCLRYIYKCFRNFAEDCWRCNIVSENINWRNPSKELLVKEIIEMMNDPERYQVFHESCAVNKLLLIRCEEIHMLATDGNKMFERIERHYQNVNLQLSRLYRMRNEIVHSALNEEESIIRYIEHLDDYLVNFAAEVIMCWEKHSQSSIEVIFQIIKDNYKMFEDIKNSKKDVDKMALLEDLRKTGIISLI